jgi:hypothetical protein
MSRPDRAPAPGRDGLTEEAAAQLSVAASALFNAYACGGAYGVAAP